MITEQQHVETIVKAAFAEISIILSFHDEAQKHLCDPEGDQVNVHYLGAECRHIILHLQVINVVEDFYVHLLFCRLCSALSVWLDILLHLLKHLMRLTGMSSRNEV